MEQTIPEFIKPYLWSYNFNFLDPQKYQLRIITNVLNYGNRKATDWLLSEYGEKEIKKVLLHPLPGEWSRKSYNFWSIIYGVSAPLKPREIFKHP